MKIYISPSMQFYNKYAYGNTSEAEQCFKIGWACYNELIRCGFEAKLAPIGQSAEQNVKESNEYGADYHICIHTNAGGGKGAVVFVTEKNKDNAVAKEIYNALNEITLYKSVYGVRVDNFYEMKNTSAKCIYVECEFHDNVELAQWIIKNTTKIGNEIAHAICKTHGVKTEEEGEKVYEYNTINEIPKAYKYTRKCVEIGIIKGKSDGLLHFTETLCRCVEICCRLICYIIGKEI